MVVFALYTFLPTVTFRDRDRFIVNGNIAFTLKGMVVSRVHIN